MIQAPTLTKANGVRHGFFTRVGGASSGLYASLNCGPGSDDDPNAVNENRARAMSELGLAADRLCTVHQMHGTAVVTPEEPWSGPERPRADALVTRAANLAIGILTADCAPVLMADTEARVIAAVHCGWKGALAGVAEAALGAMMELGAEPDRVAAAVGPCIAQRSYEVGPEFVDAFLLRDAGNEPFFAPAPKDARRLFDLQGFVRHRLAKAGIARIEVLDRDTYGEDGQFFSFRRATHRDEADYGRQLSAIALAG